MAGRQTPVFFFTLIMDTLLRIELHFLQVLCFPFTFKNYCTFKVATKNETVTVENTRTRRKLIYKANNFTFKRKKAILDEHFSSVHSTFSSKSSSVSILMRKAVLRVDTSNDYRRIDRREFFDVLFKGFAQ